MNPLRLPHTEMSYGMKISIQKSIFTGDDRLVAYIMADNTSRHHGTYDRDTNTYWTVVMMIAEDGEVLRNYISVSDKVIQCAKESLAKFVSNSRTEQ